MRHVRTDGRGAGPNQHRAIFICSTAFGINQFGSKTIEKRLIQLEFEFERLIADTPFALE